MKDISTNTFRHTLRDIHKNAENRKFCFVIGAGASFKSGIPTGGELAKLWFSEIKSWTDDFEWNNWITEQNIKEDDLAASYGSIYRKRFENDKTSGYEFLVKKMNKAKPSFGHIVLAQILSRTPGHCVLTTNFDSLVESSVYQFTDKTPLVCGHESLSGYARPSLTHPLIIKIHRDLLLEPKNDLDEINKLDPGWKSPLDHIFSTHIPIVIGYGGNDGSLMDYFENMSKPSNFFWCGLSKDNISERIKNLIIKNDGRFVQIQGFDELMHELLIVFDEIKPIKDELNEITSGRIQIAAKQLDEIMWTKTVSISSTTSFNDKKNELSALEYNSIAEKESDFEARKTIYLEALSKYPSTGWLWWKFTYFLHFEKMDYTDLDKYYEEAIKFNIDQAGILGNYALYQSETKDYIKAEEFFTKAIALDSNNSTINVNYAVFLKDKKKDYIKAEEYYLKAIAANPEDLISNANYANFLKLIKKNYSEAEKYYLKSLTIDGNNAELINNYANLLNYTAIDYSKTEQYYLKALSIAPNNPLINNNYATFLKVTKKDIVKAEEYYKKTLSADSNYANGNGNYAQFLLENGELEMATTYIQKALFINNEEKNDLLIELWFYRYACYPEFLQIAEKKVDELLSEGVKSVGWNFDQIIDIALKNNHPNPKKLKEFAKIISSD